MQTPPIRMKTDAIKYIPFKSHFVLDIFYSCANKAESDRVEAETIMSLKMLGKSGYNVMKGNPTKGPKFNYLHSRKINLSPWNTDPHTDHYFQFHKGVSYT